MKILFFTENSYAGGLDSVITDLINHWPEMSCDTPHNLVLICNRSHPGLQIVAERCNKTVNIYAHDYLLHWEWVGKVNRLPIPDIIKKAFSAITRYPFFIYWLFVAGRMFRSLSADRLLVINGGYPGGDSCRAAAVAWSVVCRRQPKCIFNFHNLAVAARWWERGAEYIIDSLVARASRCFVAVSKACAASMVHRPIIFDNAKITSIMNGISQPKPSVTLPSETNLRQEIGIPQGVSICLMLGTYEPRKGHEFLLRAFVRVLEKLPETRLLICGFGYEEDVRRVVSMVKEIGLEDRVILEGFRNDTDALIEMADVVLVSSQAYESFGLTIAEAMSRRTPVVATDVGGIPEVIGENVGGFIVPSSDFEAFADYTVSLLENNNLKKQVGIDGCRRFENHFQASRMARDYANIVCDR